jgi:hypothetical protein
VATGRTGSAIAFDLPAVYNTSAAPASGTVTVDYTGAVSGTSVLAWFNHSGVPTWPAGWTIKGNPWDNSQPNAVWLTYHSGTTVSGVVISGLAGTYVNPQIHRYPSADVSTTGTTATAVTGLSATIVQNVRYHVEVHLKVSGTATGGVNIGLFYTGSGQSQSLSGWTNNSITSGGGNTVGYIFLTGALGFNALNTTNDASVSTSSVGQIHLSGTIIGSSSGDTTMDMRFASVTSGQNATLYTEGSYITLTRQ